MNLLILVHIIPSAAQTTTLAPEGYRLMADWISSAFSSHNVRSDGAE